MKYYQLNKKSYKPLYIQIAEVIKRNIHEGLLRIGDLIPSESQIMTKYGVSRITVRNAFLRLVYDGDIFKTPGKGSFVSEKRFEEIPSPSISFDKQMKRQGIPISYRLSEFCDVYPIERVMRELKIASGEMVTKIKRVIIANDGEVEKTIGMKTLFVPLDIGRGLKDVDLTQISLIEHFNSSSDSQIGKMEVIIRAAIVENADAEDMGIDFDNLVLIREGVYWNHFDRPVMCGKVLYLAERAIVKMVIDVESSASSLNDVPILKKQLY
jgi:GntR family transcriptional regulator